MRIKKAEYVKDHKIKLLFSDGVIKVVDFKQFLNSTRKLIAPLIKEDYFKKFFVDEITICWPNGLDFSPDVLYEIGKEIATKEQKPKTKIRSVRKSIVETTKKYN